MKGLIIIRLAELATKIITRVKVEVAIPFKSIPLKSQVRRPLTHRTTMK